MAAGLHISYFLSLNKILRLQCFLFFKIFLLLLLSLLRSVSSFLPIFLFQQRKCLRSLHSFNIYLILCSCYFRWFMCALFSPMLVYICNFFLCVHFAFSLASLLLRSSYYSCKFTASNFISLIFFSFYFIVRSSTHSTNEKPRASGEMPCWHTDGCNAKKNHINTFNQAELWLKILMTKVWLGLIACFHSYVFFFLQFFYVHKISNREGFIIFC